MMEDKGEEGPSERPDGDAAFGKMARAAPLWQGIKKREKGRQTEEAIRSLAWACKEGKVRYKASAATLKPHPPPRPHPLALTL